jgi:hypothetical protein
LEVKPMNIKKESMVIALTVPILYAISAYGHLKSQTSLSISQQTSPAPVAESKRLEMSAVVKKGEASGEYILALTLRNISNADIIFRDDNLFRDYTLKIVDENNDPVQLTERGRQAQTGSYFISHRKQFVIHAGEQVERRFVLSGLYDLKAGVSYTAIVKRVIASQDGRGREEVKSQAIKFKIE